MAIDIHPDIGNAQDASISFTERSRTTVAATATSQYCADARYKFALGICMVVTVGALHSMGVDAEGAWKEVMRSNFAKIDKKTGMVRKREDGKILKPQGWEPPRLAQFVTTE